MARYGSLHEGLPAGKVVGFSGITIGFLAAMVGALAQGAFGQDTLTTWPYNTPITLNTSATGASVTTKQSNFPVLVRLTSANAAAVFAGAQANGADLRFSRSATDTAQFPYQISKYNQATQTAYIWVAPDTVGGSNATQSVQMWWGKGAAAAKSNGPAVFAPSNGFVAVWHLDSAGVAGNGKETFNDATGNGYMDTGTTTIVDSPSVILDSARALNKWNLPSTAGGQGDSIYINSLLGSPGNGAGHSVTFSAWGKLDSLDLKSKTGTGVTTLFSLGNNLSAEIHGGGDVNDSLHLAYHASAGWSLQPMGKIGLISPPAWKHIAVVVTSASSTADTAYVYVNGAAATSLVTNNANSGVMVYSSAAGTSKYAVLGADNGNTSRTAFFGEMCEARVENVRRSPDWLKLSYQNEQAADALTSLSAVGPAAPALSQPANMAVGQAVNLSLSWNSSALASAYSVQVSTDVNFGSTVFQQSGLAVTSAAPTGLANGTLYYWRANATNGSYTSSWSGAWSFLTIALFGAPPLVTPTNSAINQSTAPTVTWGAVSGATTYWLQVSTESGFVTPIFNSSTLTSTSQSLSGLSNYTTYYWEVNANNGSTYGGWSSLWSFTTVIAMPVLSSPSSGAVNQPVTLTLNWGAVPGAASYSLEVSSSATFAGTPAVNLSGITNLSQAVSGLATSTTYYWEVSATGGNGGTGAWSASWSFTTVPPVPGVPTLSVPANGASGQPLSLIFSWSSSAGGAPASYELQLATISDFSTIVSDINGITSTSQTLGPLSYVTTYYWRVNAVNGGGASAWSSVRAFTSVENYNLWSYHKQFSLNTTSSGANVANNVTKFPVLLRLNPSNFSGWGQLNYQTGGAVDIRFSGGSDYTKAFPYQIDYWSATNDTAVIWVWVDTVFGNNASQSIAMHYGKSGAISQSNGAAVFDTANGYQGVWHLSDTTDATINSYNDSGSTGYLPKDTIGVIGRGRYFSGSNYLATAGSKITSGNVPFGGPFTLSAWVYFNSGTAVQAIIAGTGQYGYQLQRDGGGKWEVADFGGSPGGWYYDSSGTVPTGSWHHVVGVRNNIGTSPTYSESLYVDGVLLSSTVRTSTNSTARKSTNFNIGKRADTVITVGSTLAQAMTGIIDEVEMSTVPRSANWVKLSFQNQQANQTLVALATLPSIPTLASPTNNATSQPTALTLSWNSVAGALTYEVQVATAAGFGAATVSDQAGLTGVSATVAGLAGSTTYYWQVNATNGAGTTAWSAAWSFTTTIGSPALSSPANGATGQPVTLSLSWGSVSGAVSYGVQVSTDMSFGSTMSGQSGLTGLYDVVSGLTGGVTYYWEVDATGAAATGAWSGAWSFSAGMTQVIPLNTAWNMKSLNVIPLQDTTTMVFGTDPGGFLFVKDNAGDVYCPAAYQDNINYVQVGQGYQVYTTVPDTMEVMGIPVNYAATAIALSSGWNTIAYLPPSDDSIEHALAGIDTLLIIVKNNSGHAYWPSLGIDDIGIMYVGEGYKVLMSSAASLTYPTPDTGVAKRVAARGGKTMLRLPEPRHYATHANTGNNATLLAKRVTIGDKVVPDSSEIGAFDGTGSLVGSGTVMHGIAAFAVWGVDPQSKTKKKDGCAVLEPVTFRLWDGKREYPLDYVTQDGTPAKYGVDKVFLGVLSVPEGYLITKFDLTRAYPNPFRGSVKIAFDVPTIGGVTQHVIELAVYDLKGSLVKQLASGIYRAGHYALSWNSGEGRESVVGSSVYIVRMKAANFDKRLKLVRIQ